MTSSAIQVFDAQRILDWCNTLASHSEDDHGLTCTYLSHAHRAVARQIAAWMTEYGFDSVQIDTVGNVIGRYQGSPSSSGPGDESSSSTLPTASMSNLGLVATGSHYDTVRNAGRFDGRLGILLPMAIVGGLHAEGRRLPFDLEVVAFAEEEGVRFGSTYLGSSAYAGCFDVNLLSRADADGVTLREAIRDAGGDPAGLSAAPARLGSLRHYFEVHIEQGPALLGQGIAVGVVTAIAGAVRRRISLAGTASHAGTTPMSMRHDAACAAAEIILAVERRCSVTQGLVGTVGQLQVPGGSVNVIPGACHLSLDVRADDDAVRDAALADIDAAIEEITARRGVTWQCEPLLQGPAVPCSPEYRGYWCDAIQDNGLPVIELPSGAGHDAVLMSRIAPVSMLFVRCGNGGISHNPLETVSRDDVQTALAVTRSFLDRIGPSLARGDAEPGA